MTTKPDAGVDVNAKTLSGGLAQPHTRVEISNDLLHAILIVLAFFALVGVAGWLTDVEPVKYQIEQRQELPTQKKGVWT